MYCKFNIFAILTAAVSNCFGLVARTFSLLSHVNLKKLTQSRQSKTVFSTTNPADCDIMDENVFVANLTKEQMAKFAVVGQKMIKVGREGARGKEREGNGREGKGR